MKKRQSKRRILKVICDIVCGLGFLLMLGTAGASDMDTITFGQIVLQLTLGLAMFIGGAYLGGLMQ